MNLATHALAGAVIIFGQHIPFFLFSLTGWLLIGLSIAFSSSAWSQFIPSQYSDVQANKNYEFTLVREEPFGILIGANVLWTPNGTLHIARVLLNDQEVLVHRSTNNDPGTGPITGSIGRLIQGALKAGTKLRLKGIVEASRDSSARLFSLSASPVSYDAAVNLANLERQIHNLATQAGQNTNKIEEITNQLAILKTDLTQFRERLEGFAIGHNQFKADVTARLAAIDEKIAVLEKNLNGAINQLSQRFDTFLADEDKWKADIHSQFGITEKRLSEMENNPSMLGSRMVPLEKNIPNLSSMNNRISTLENQLDKNSLFPLNNRLSALENTLGNRVSILEKEYQNRKTPALSSLESRIVKLENRKQRTSWHRHSDILGIIGTSLGGTAALMAGAALYQTYSDRPRQDRQQEAGKEKIP